MKTLHPIAVGMITLGLTVAGGLQAHGDNKSHNMEPKLHPNEREQTAWGIAGNVNKAARTVHVAMLDKMRFDPPSVKVARGETIRFIIKNTGQIMHEFVLGTKATLDEHAALMMKFPNMEHEEPYMAHVAPGKTGEIVWVFNRSGDFFFACLIPGHYQAGMVGNLDVNGT